MGADTSAPPPAPPHLTPREWLVLVLAALGFAFDIYELLMLPLIVRPALLDLLDARPGTPSFGLWVGLLFYLPAVCGGVFGLLGGWLTDRFGRIRVLTWSILLYAGSALAAGLSTSAGMLLFFRCTTFVGVCVEFVAAVAWLAELFPEPRRREAVLGYTQAFSSFGGLLVTGAYYIAVSMADRLPAIQGGHEAWRYTLVSGVIPALPLIAIRPFLPESPVWRDRRDRGLLARPSVLELFRPRLRRTTLVTTLLFACAYGAAFGALQHTPRMVPGLPQVESLDAPLQQKAVSRVQAFQEVGGLVGRMALAFLAVRIVGRRRLLRVFQVPALIVLPAVFLYPAVHDLRLLQWGIFVAGFLVVGQFSFWGNYLPRMYPVHLRGTGESFATNIGGRLIGTSAALVTTQLALVLPGADASESLAYAAALVATVACAIGLVASRWLPEPGGEGLLED